MEDVNPCIIVMMKMIADRWSAILSASAKLPLSSAQCRVVMYLESLGGGPVSQQNIGRHLGITHTTAKGLLQRLEDKGFIRTAFDSTDKRVKNVYLTDKSLALKEQVQNTFSGVVEQMLSGISQAERDQLALLLTRIYDNIKC